jgi:hypothetical protein
MKAMKFINVNQFALLDFKLGAHFEDGSVMPKHVRVQ